MLRRATCARHGSRQRDAIGECNRPHDVRPEFMLGNGGSRTTHPTKTTKTRRRCPLVRRTQSGAASGDRTLPRPLLHRHRVDTAGTERVTADDTSHRKSQSAKEAVSTQGLQGVLAARGAELTSAEKVRTHKNLVRANQDGQRRDQALSQRSRRGPGRSDDADVERFGRWQVDRRVHAWNCTRFPRDSQSWFTKNGPHSGPYEEPRARASGSYVRCCSLEEPPSYESH